MDKIHKGDHTQSSKPQFKAHSLIPGKESYCEHDHTSRRLFSMSREDNFDLEKKMGVNYY